MYRIFYTKQAMKEIAKLKESKIDNKAKTLIDLIRKNPYQNPPGYAKLVGNLDGLLSRKINYHHRLVYQVSDSPYMQDGTEYQGTIKVIRMWTHYESAENM